MSDSLGDRIKRYENVFHYSLTRRTPLMIRVDGRAFHTFTKGCNRPFDQNIMQAMVSSANTLAEEMQGFKVAYIQSDEATFLLTDYDRLETQSWFDYDLSKVVSISASVMSVNFNHFVKNVGNPVVFDSRAFSVPENDVANAFVWRAKDWERNSLQMYCRSYFSHKELHQKNREDMHDMLHSIGKNWTTDLSNREKNGTFLINTEYGIDVRDNILPNYDSISTLIKDVI